MVDYSIFEKFDILISTISKSPFFAISAVVGIVILTLAIIGFVKSKKINKIIYISGWAFVFVFFIIRYWSFIVGLGDNFINNIFMAIYFPNLAVYTTLFILCNGFFVYTIVNENLNRVNKIINVVITILFDFLFLLIIDVVSENSIDIYSSLTVYSNPTLLVLLELSTAICLIWLAVTLFYKGIVFFNSKKATVNNETYSSSPTTMVVDELKPQRVLNDEFKEVSKNYNESLWTRSVVSDFNSSMNVIEEKVANDVSLVDEKEVDSGAYDIFNINVSNNKTDISNFDNDSKFIWKVKTRSGSLSFDQVSVYKVMNLSLDKEISKNVFNVDKLSIGQNNLSNENIR